MSVTIARDAIAANVRHLPVGQTAGYTTGTSDIRWTEQMWEAHPDAIRICQDADGSDRTADWLDVERGAATIEVAGSWFKVALVNYRRAARPGQRYPAVYVSASNVTPLVNGLIREGIREGVSLVVANWNTSDEQATHEILDASGPFPIVGMQIDNGPFFDVDVVSLPWLNARSVKPKPMGSIHGVVVIDDLTTIQVTSADRHLWVSVG